VDPQVIIFGGGLSKAGSTLLDLVYHHMDAKAWTVLPSPVKLLLSQSDNGGVVGAALAAQKKFGKHKIGDCTVATHNRQIACCGMTMTSLCWVAPVLVVSSALSLALTFKPSEAKSSEMVKKVLLSGQLGLSALLVYWNAKRFFASSAL
jgi:hypothetical protein